MPGRGPKIFQVEQKERLLFVSFAFSKLDKLILLVVYYISTVLPV